MDVKTAIETGNVAALRELLAADPTLANRHVVWGTNREIQTHPLHFVSDTLFDGTLDKNREADVAVALIDALIHAGADVNHFSPDNSRGEPKCETPLNGAASLGAQEVGIRLIEAGAKTDAIAHVCDSNWDASPLGWAMHGWFEPPPASAGRHREVVVALVRAGAEVKAEWLSAQPIQADARKAAAIRGEP